MINASHIASTGDPDASNAEEYYVTWFRLPFEKSKS
jgi:hypothetical protein